jgi:hypothetical protein
MSYELLIDQRFSVDGEIFVVRELIATEESIRVEAHPEESSEGSRVFELSDVIDWLLVDEEIVLFNPNYLAAI